MTLVPCDGCRRHVRAADARCPFCAAPVPTAPPESSRRVSRRGNLTRAAIFYLGASVASACGGEVPWEEPIAQPYGAPPDPEPDPDPEEPESEEPESEEQDRGAVAAPYGAPPEPEPEPEPEPLPESAEGDAIQQGAGAYGAPPMP
ncbi:MAG: hypothetical protein EVA89_12125 [Sandaracinaceae bacterium]|nr:MAG: hypothetical protein EVA89_12125 [Sandaracinaceae bacterium]